MRRLHILTIASLLLLSSQTMAQENIHVRVSDYDTMWDFPFITDEISHFDISPSDNQLNAYSTNGIVIPFDADKVRQVTFEDAPAEETKDHYKVFQMYISTEDGVEIVSRDDYLPCYISLNAQGSFSNYSASAQIRGRGNKLLGLGKAKSWVLLANYRDVTDLMNTFVFELGQWLGLPYTNHTRYVELFINGDYKGVYQLTEQIQQGSNRVEVSDEKGILVSLDVDDGPGEAPYEEDNFWSTVYHMPMAVKYPDDDMLTPAVRDSIRDVFAELENAIRNRNYPKVDSMLDIQSFIHYLQIQEFIYNVELSAPRSIYMHKEGDGKWVMGPLWDFDAGYDFDWANMTTGHTFFSDYKETVMGTNPYKRNGNYNYVPQFFTNLFGCKEFVRLYKEEWNKISDSIVSRNWGEMEKYIANLSNGPMTREAAKWPVSRKFFEAEVEKMHRWLESRAQYMTELINNIPEPEDSPADEEQFCGTMVCNVTMDKNDGYSQKVQIHVSKDELLDLLDVDAESFAESKVTIVPLNADGTEGQNHTNGVFGGWFNEEGNPLTWGEGHVYIEVYNDLFNWTCGVHPYNCYDDEHTVTMQIQYPVKSVLKKVNVEVRFTIVNQGGWWW